MTETMIEWAGRTTGIGAAVIVSVAIAFMFLYGTLQGNPVALLLWIVGLLLALSFMVGLVVRFTLEVLLPGWR